MHDSNFESDAVTTSEHDPLESDDTLDSLEQRLKNILPDAKFPNSYTVVTGALDAKKVACLTKANVQVVLNLQPNDELLFDEAASVLAHGMDYVHLPIAGADDLKQVNLLAFDRVMREHQGKTILMHCKSGNRVGACMALRAGWLRGRKMDTAMAQGFAYGLQGLEEEVRNRLLVPR